MKLSEVKKQASYLNGVIELTEKRNRAPTSIKWTGKSDRILGVADPNQILSGKLTDFANEYMCEIKLLADEYREKYVTAKTDARAWAQLDSLPVFNSNEEMLLQCGFVRVGKIEVSEKVIRGKFKTNDRYAPGILFSQAWGNAWKNVMVPAINEWLKNEGIKG